jgi:hypothetical protein
MLAQRIPGFGTVIDSGGISRRALERQFEPIVNRLRAVAKASNSRLINPMDFLCTLKVCPAIGSDGKPIYADAHHMRASYVRHRALFIDEVVTH